MKPLEMTTVSAVVKQDNSKGTGPAQLSLAMASEGKEGEVAFRQRRHFKKHGQDDSAGVDITVSFQDCFSAAVEK